MNAIWKPCMGYDGLYEVSDQGQVRSLDRMSFNGKRLRGKVLKPRPSDGYFYVALFRDGQRLSIKIARLVAEAFVPNPNQLPEVNHRFGDKLDDRATELEWITRSGNIQHAFQTGLNKPHRGEDHGQAKLNWEQVREIRAKWATGKFKQRDLATAYGVCQMVIWAVVNNQLWEEAA